MPAEGHSLALQADRTPVPAEDRSPAQEASRTLAQAEDHTPEQAENRSLAREASRSPAPAEDRNPVRVEERIQAAVRSPEAARPSFPGGLAAAADSSNHHGEGGCGIPGGPGTGGGRGRPGGEIDGAEIDGAEIDGMSAGGRQPEPSTSTPHAKKKKEPRGFMGSSRKERRYHESRAIAGWMTSGARLDYSARHGLRS
jgi:hypothetical protein